MPELPDVEGSRRFWACEAAGQCVTHVRVPDRGVLRNTSPQGLGRALADRRLLQPERHGKWLFAPTEGGSTVVFHFGMTSGFASARSSTLDEHDRVVFELDRGWVSYRSQRKLGGLWLAGSARERESITGPLGPDAGTIDQAELRARLKPRNGSVKSALMNQRVVAGIGNELSDEVLWRARIHPKRRLDDLSDRDLDNLARAFEGAVSDSVDAGRIPDTGDWLNSVRGNDSRLCPRCGGEVARQTVAGRTAYWCTSEQH